MTSRSGSCVISTAGSGSQQRHGVFASEHSLDAHSCGNSASPWLFTLAPSQTLTLTLRDFSDSPARESEPANRGPIREHCEVYVVIKSIGHKTDTMCAHDAMQVRRAGGWLHQFNVTHPDVEVRLLPGSSDKRRYFLLEYASTRARKNTTDILTDVHVRLRLS